MRPYIQRIEAGFTAFGRLAARRRLTVLLLVLLVLGAIFSQLPRIRFDPSTEGFFHDDDPLVVDYGRFREQFGRDELIVLAVNPPQVFHQGFLRKLKAFHEALEAEVPHLEEVTSLVNARLIQGRADELLVGELMEDWPESEQALARLKRRVLANPLYRNLMISEDARFTTVVIETSNYSSAGEEENLLSGFDADQPGEDSRKRRILTDEENSEVVSAVSAVVDRFAGKDFPVYMAGSPVVTDYLKRAMRQDMARFLGLAVLAIGVLLFVLFRRISAVVLPLLIVLLSLAATIGLMAAFDVPLKLPTMILPSFVLAVGVGDSVHILTIFYRRFSQSNDKEEAIAHALGHSGLPVLMTSLTTAGALGSFMTAKVAPIADLGLFAALGVLIAMVLTVVMLPALLALAPLSPVPRRQKPARAGAREASPLDRLLNFAADFSTTRPGWVLAGCGLLIAFVAAGLTRLDFSHNPLLWFPEHSEIRQATEMIDRELKGSLTLEFIIDTGRENGLYEPEILKKLEALGEYAERFEPAGGGALVGQTISVADVLKEIHKALNENRPEFYAIPDNRRLIAQELLLFENSGSDDLEDVVDSRFSMARLTAKVPWRDAATYVDSVRALTAKAEEIFAGQAQVTATGLMVLFASSIHNMMESTVVSYTIAAVVIALLMILMLGSVRIGLLSMLPNLYPIVFTLGMMGWLGLPLDMFTLLIGGIAIGLAVDDTIHFFHNYRRYQGQGMDARAAVRETMHTTGRAMLFTTLVLVTGFWVFLFASLNNLFSFGLLTGTTLIVALLADFTLAPALLASVERRGRRPAMRKSGGTS